MQLLNKKLFTISIVGIVLVESLSFLSFQYPAIAPWVFGVVALTALILTIKNLEWGVYLIFAELVIGSFGKLFVLQFGDIELSIRIMLWLIVMSVWLGQAARTRRITFLHSQFFKPYLILGTVIVWGVAWGLIRGHDFGAVFFDVNNYLYFLLIFPVYEIMSSGRDAKFRVSTILLAAITWLSIKTIALFYIFSHELFWLQDILYDWSRRMQLVEITNISPVFLTARIFMQSQIWILFGLFIGLGYVFMSLRGSHAKRDDRSNLTVAMNKSSTSDSSNAPIRLLRSATAEFMPSTLGLAMTVILSTVLIMSFSRSFWLAVVVSLVMLIAILLFVMRERFSYVLKFSAINIGVIILAVGLSIGVMTFPLPRGQVSNAGVLKERIEKFSSEPAASSRFSQIRPLLTAIAKHPAIGSGFGTAVTYQSQDPRIVKSHPDGWYTTTAFELGWLEMWLKIGLVGVGAYLYLLWKILKATRIIRMHPNNPNKNLDRFLTLGGLIGLVAVVITHGVSPYLNHPLGIGVVMLVTAVVDNSNVS